MDFEDFLIEYDLSESQLQLAKRLKAEANFRQLLNVLGDHALFYSRQLRPAQFSKCRRRTEVLDWFSSLSVEERLAVLSCNEEGWVQVVLKMSRHLAGHRNAEGHFKVTLKPTSGRSRRPETKVHYRRPHRLPDGELLAPPATPGFRAAARRLLGQLRVAFRSSMAIDWGEVLPAPGLVADAEAFVNMMDELSLGRFLQEEPTKQSSTPWPEAIWLSQWGSHFPCASFLASRLEVLLLQGYDTRLAKEPARPAMLPLAEVWASMPREQHEIVWARLGRSLLRRLLSETLAAAFHDADTLPTGLAELLEGPSLGHDGGVGLAPPLELISAACSLQLRQAADPEDGLAEVLLSYPRMWLHQQMSVELAIVCSEWSASLWSTKEDEALRKTRLSKKQKQKLRRRKLEADREEVELQKRLEVPEPPEEPLPFTKSSLTEDFDYNFDARSELSSVCHGTTRSSSVCDSLQTATAVQYAMMQRSFWDAELRQVLRARAATTTCHDDSRLEFLLRNRDRAEVDWDHWDHLSQGSMPASLDEGALYPVGLESRFAYLFDSPARSHVTTALASQCTAEEDVELHAQWEDENLVEWQNLTEALEKSEAEKEMWRGKARELEDLLLQRAGAAGGGAEEALERSVSSEVERAEASRRSRRPSLGGSEDASRRKWRYLVLLLLARQQLDIRDVKDQAKRLESPVETLEVARIGRAVSLDLTEGPAPSRARALVTFHARVKGGICCDAATQTAPAITLSKMYGGIVPHYIQRELARLRQENQLLRYKIASVAMSQPKRSAVRHQATQTAPALTFSTGRGRQWVTTMSRPHSTHQVPPSRYEPPELEQQMLQASILAYVRSVEVQIETQAPYRRAVITNCKRVAQTLWPRSSLELYGSYASGLGLRTSGLDLLLKVHPSFHGFATSETPEEQAALSPIEEDDEQLRQLKLEEVSPAHSARSVRPLQGWQQQLSDRLAKEKWVVSDSIRVAAHAAIPVLSFAAAPEVKRVSPENELSFMACSTRVDICLHDSGYRGLRSKALINFLLNRFPLARPVTLVLKQWLIEQAYSMSHSGGLCSYGLLLMVIAFLQYSPANTAAAALVGFLNFYGHRFDPQLYGVSVARSAFLPRKSPTSWPPQQAELVERGFLSNPGDNEEAHRFDPLLVEDPVNPTNNVGRNCFRIRQIQRSLARAADLISGEGTTLRALLRVDGPGQEGEDGYLSKHDPHEDLYLSLVEHGNGRNLMLPVSAQGRMARSHLPQQWDSVVRYTESTGRLPGAARY